MKQKDILTSTIKKVKQILVIRKVSDNILLVYCLLFMLPGFIMNNDVYDLNRFVTYFVAVVLLYNVLRILPRSLGILLLLVNLYYNFTNITHYLQYETRLKTGSLIGIFFTDYAEAAEFFYILPIQYVLIILLYAMFGLVSTLFLIVASKNKRRVSMAKYAIIILLFALVNIYMQQYDRFSFFHYSFVHLKHFYWEYKIARAYDYRRELFEEEKKNLPQKQIVNDGQLHVIVLGESLGRSHMSIYGYKRETMPRIGERLAELILIDNAIAPANMTELSLPLSLTPAHASDTDILLKSLSMIGRLKLKGYKILWISNQGEPLSKNTPIRLLLSEVDELIYTWKNNKNKSDTSEKQEGYDGEMLRIFDDVLSRYADKKQPMLIFIHMKGSHARYERRVPKDKAIFKPYLEKKDRYGYHNKQKIINSYDNTVYYLDYFLNQIFVKLETQLKPATLFFFSDHGEMVFDRDDRRFAHGYSNPYKEEYKVPFFYWGNEQNKCLRSLSSPLNSAGINLSYFHQIFLYAVCLDDKLPNSLYDDNVLALGQRLSYESLP